MTSSSSVANELIKSQIVDNRRGMSFRMKKPSSSSSSLATFWYRVVVILVSVVPAWIAVAILGGLNNLEVTPSILLFGIGVAIVPLILGELLRKSIFEKAISRRSEDVIVNVTASGLKLTDSDLLLLSQGRDEFQSGFVSFYNPFGKRLFDLVICGVTLLILGPVMMILAFFIKLSDGGPALYSTKRIGKNGVEFRIFKFRTMAPSSDEVLREHLARSPQARHEWETFQKIAEDPRITQIGRFLRKTSLDEIPQLWNVLVGTMSIVGPRAILPEQKSLYSSSAYFSIKPGITGLWQVSDRFQTSLSSRLRFDDEYARRVSFRLDLLLILRTVSVVTRETGA